MTEHPEYRISVSGDISSEEASSLLRRIRAHLVARGISEANVMVPVEILILHDNRTIFVCVSLTELSATSGRLFVEDYRQVDELTVQKAMAISRKKYGFSTPYVFSLPRQRLEAVDTKISVLPPFNGGLDKTKCFVAMPFSPEMDAVYGQIRSVFSGLKRRGLTCFRGDDSAKPEVITDHIWREINESFFLIADLTGRNANVYYEVGLAHAIGKPVILITQDPDVPFDLRGVRRIHYSLQSQSEVELFKSELKKAINEMMDLINRAGRAEETS